MSDLSQGWGWWQASYGKSLTPSSRARLSKLSAVSSSSLRFTTSVPRLPGLIVGEEDDNPGVSAAASLAAHIAGANLTVLPDTGHLSALEHPDRFSEALLAFVGRL